jgi:hypothetical protein
VQLDWLVWATPNELNCSDLIIDKKLCSGHGTCEQYNPPVTPPPSFNFPTASPSHPSTVSPTPAPNHGQCACEWGWDMPFCATCAKSFFRSGSNCVPCPGLTDPGCSKACCGNGDCVTSNTPPAYEWADESGSEEWADEEWGQGGPKGLAVAAARRLASASPSYPFMLGASRRPTAAPTAPIGACTCKPKFAAVGPHFDCNACSTNRYSEYR